MTTHATQYQRLFTLPLKEKGLAYTLDDWLYSVTTVVDSSVL